MKIARNRGAARWAACFMLVFLGRGLFAGDLQLMADSTTEAMRWNAAVQKVPDRLSSGTGESVRQSLLDRAALWGRFQADFPRSARVREAKRQEAISLLKAGWAGDDSASVRRAQLAASVRGDSSFTPEDRFEVASFMERLELARTAGLSRGQRIEREEQIARKLASEFPTVPAAYESLLGIARCSSDDRAVGLLDDLVNSGAPDSLKREAARLLQRYDLVGTPLIGQLQSVAGAGRIKRGENDVIVFYIWSQRDLRSQELAKEAASIVMPGLRLISLEIDAPESTEGGERFEPPGERLDLDAGQVALLRQRLRLEEVPLIYVTDRSGRIHSVSAQNNISAAVIAASLQ